MKILRSDQLLLIAFIVEGKKSLPFSCERHRYILRRSSNAGGRGNDSRVGITKSKWMETRDLGKSRLPRRDHNWMGNKRNNFRICSKIFCAIMALIEHEVNLPLPQKVGIIRLSSSRRLLTCHRRNDLRTLLLDFCHSQSESYRRFFLDWLLLHHVLHACAWRDLVT